MSDVDVSQAREVVGALRRLLAALPVARQRQLWRLTAIMLFAALAEVASLGALIPFLSLLASPDDSSLARGVSERIQAALGLPTTDTMLVMTAAFATLAVLAAIARIALNVALARTNFRIGHEIGSLIYARALHQPYEYHVRHNSAEIVGGVVKVDVAIYVLLAVLIGISSAVLALCIVATILSVNAGVAIVAVLGFGGTYVLISRLIHARLLANGRVINSANPARLQAMQEGLGGIRDVILDHTQAYHGQRFDEIDGALRRAQESNQIFGPTPRYLIEAIAMVVIAVLGCWFALRGGGIAAALPTLGVLVLGGQRLLPLLQQSYQGWVMIAGHLAVVSEVTQLMSNGTAPDRSPHPSRLPFRQSIEFDRVRFRFEGAPIDVLRDATFTIRRGERVGIVGPTGSGKSTLLNLLMGLLEPSEGDLRIDGQSVAGAQRRAWQQNIAHVPQSIFLSDASVRENVAFGVSPDEIDEADVRKALKRAQLSDWVDTLPQGIDTLVGENGVRLSGGQRQRLGIARALYKQATVLILDEATSALDDTTEAEVIRSVEALGRDITLIMIAHRLSTLGGCDMLLRVEAGLVVATERTSEAISKDGPSPDEHESR